MPGLLCVWANLPDDAITWYEDEWLPDMREQNSIHTLHSQYTTNGFEGEPIGQLDSPWPWCAVYDVPDVRKATEACYNNRNFPPEEMLAGPLKTARFDTKTYKELRRWQNGGWNGDPTQIGSVTLMEWRALKDKEQEILHWYTTYLAPQVSSSDQVLRFRLFELDNATVLEGTEHSTTEKDALHTYFTAVEFDTEDWPWEYVIALAENEKWREYFEGQKEVIWQISHYLVKKCYTEAGVFDIDKDVSSDESPPGSSAGPSSG
ncbi:hypothetical protein EK21DRAFT_91861 [Setomelanomma holmii]|uniref:Uncharacterized protein n=1 Tax=Setomelanomma holmii TaxID=210430 RepID=A0A9P4LJ00_9PLEO|nr:hypothetical protein EK21DRAFT_91861 [Setomelanomma holmii]